MTSTTKEFIDSFESSLHNTCENVDVNIKVCNDDDDDLTIFCKQCFHFT